MLQANFFFGGLCFFFSRIMFVTAIWGKRYGNKINGEIFYGVNIHVLLRSDSIMYNCLFRRFVQWWKKIVKCNLVFLFYVYFRLSVHVTTDYREMLFLLYSLYPFRFSIFSIHFSFVFNAKIYDYLEFIKS